MKNKKYAIKKAYGNYPIGTEVIIRENDDTHVLVSIDGTLEYISKVTFWIITGQI